MVGKPREVVGHAAHVVLACPRTSRRARAAGRPPSACRFCRARPRPPWPAFPAPPHPGTAPRAARRTRWPTGSPTECSTPARTATRPRAASSRGRTRSARPRPAATRTRAARNPATTRRTSRAQPQDAIRVVRAEFVREPLRRGAQGLGVLDEPDDLLQRALAGRAQDAAFEQALEIERPGEQVVAEGLGHGAGFAGEVGSRRRRSRPGSRADRRAPAGRRSRARSCPERSSLDGHLELAPGVVEDGRRARRAAQERADLALGTALRVMLHRPRRTEKKQQQRALVPRADRTPRRPPPRASGNARPAPPRGPFPRFPPPPPTRRGHRPSAQQTSVSQPGAPKRSAARPADSGQQTAARLERDGLPFALAVGVAVFVVVVVPVPARQAAPVSRGTNFGQRKFCQRQKWMAVVQVCFSTSVLPSTCLTTTRRRIARRANPPPRRIVRNCRCSRPPPQREPARWWCTASATRLARRSPGSLPRVAMASLRVFDSKATASRRGSSDSTRATFSTMHAPSAAAFPDPFLPAGSAGAGESVDFMGQNQRESQKRSSTSMGRRSTGNVAASNPLA